jgi:hypothetical protein
MKKAVPDYFAVAIGKAFSRNGRSIHNLAVMGLPPPLIV